MERGEMSDIMQRMVEIEAAKVAAAGDAVVGLVKLHGAAAAHDSTRRQDRQYLHAGRLLRSF